MRNYKMCDEKYLIIFILQKSWLFCESLSLENYFLMITSGK